MAAAGLGNPAGFVQALDFGQPKILPGVARNEIISGGVFVFGSGASGVVSSGLNSFATGDILFTRDASGGQFNGINVQTSAVSGNMAVATDGVFLLVCNGALIGGERVECDGNNAVLSVGSTTSTTYSQNKSIGRAITAGASGGYALIQIGGC